MAIAATNRSKVSYIAEASRGVTPNTPKFKELRVTSSELNFEPTRVTSNEIRADRQVTDSILTQVAANGNIGIELSFKAYDDMLEAAVQGTWSSKPSIAVATADTEISDVSATTLTVAASGGAFKTGHLTLLSGFSTEENNGPFRVDASSFATLQTLATQEIGIWIDRETTALRATYDVLRSIGGFIAPDHQGRLTIGRLDAPGTPVTTIVDPDILTSSRDETLSFLANPDTDGNVPTHSVLLNYRKNWHVHTDSDLGHCSNFGDPTRGNALKNPSSGATSQRSTISPRSTGLAKARSMSAALAAISRAVT